MKIQIVYLSKTGNTAKLAHALVKVFPSDCELVDINLRQPSLDADIYLIGFGVQRGACPFVLLDWLEELEGKQILLFSTCGLAAFPEYRRKLESLIIPFLPDHCTYHGVYLCQGSISQAGFDYLKSCLNNPADGRSIQNLEQLYQDSQSHPNQQEIEALIDFVRQKLSNKTP